MTRAALPTLLIALAAVFISACNKKACERFCDCDDLDYSLSFFDDFYDDYSDDGISPDDDDCRGACEKALDEAKPACRFSFRSAARCLDKTGCDEEECADQLVEADVNCYLDL